MPPRPKSKGDTEQRSGNLLVLRSPLLEAIPWLRHGFSTRAGGVTTVYSGGPGELNCGNADEDSPANVATNRRLFLQAMWGDEPLPELVTIRQVHSSVVWNNPRDCPAGDALFTTIPERALSVRVADCVPIVLADPRRRAVAAIHAGWRGTVSRIAEKTIGEMKAQLGSRAEDIRAAIGPSIRSCCYEVGQEVVDSFRAQFDYADDLLHHGEADPVRARYPALFMTGAPPGHPYEPRWNPDERARLDLAEANRRQLLAAGLSPEAIDVLSYCTSCRADLFFSHRRDAGHTGRMIAAVGLIDKK